MALVVKFTLHFILPHIFAYIEVLTGRYCNLQIYSGVHTFHAVFYTLITGKASEHFTKCKSNQDTHTDHSTPYICHNIHLLLPTDWLTACHLHVQVSLHL